MIEVIETCPNPKGLAAVSPSKEVCILACPDKKLGLVRVVHFDKGSKIQIINAHQSSISAIVLNHEGNLLATASDKGTLVRLFETQTGEQLQELRRGSDHAEIYSLSFDLNSTLLACTSDKGTIHIFALK